MVISSLERSARAFLGLCSLSLIGLHVHAAFHVSMRSAEDLTLLNTFLA